MFVCLLTFSTSVSAWYKLHFIPVHNTIRHSCVAVTIAGIQLTYSSVMMGKERRLEWRRSGRPQAMERRSERLSQSAAPGGEGCWYCARYQRCAHTGRWWAILTTSRQLSAYM